MSFVMDKLLPLINSDKSHNDHSYYHLLSNYYVQGTWQTFFQIFTTTLKKKKNSEGLNHLFNAKQLEHVRAEVRAKLFCLYLFLVFCACEPK